jgi:DNA polymerase I-like protein with 3'-5' exonuclease and polymerase domains
MESHIIDYPEAFAALKEHIAQQQFEYLVIDTETDNKIEKLANLVGFGFCINDTEAFYIPFRKKDKSQWWTGGKEHEIVGWLTDLCKSHKLIAHNGIYDILVLYYNWNVDLTEYLHADTILMKHLTNEERPFGLKEVAVQYLGPWADKAQQALYDNIKANGGRTTKENTDMWIADTQILGEYCCHDVLLTYKLFVLFEQKLKDEGLMDLFYKDEIMPLYKEVTIPMKKKGFPIDVPYFQQLNEDINNEIVLLEERIQTILKPEVEEFCSVFLEEEYPVKISGSFPKHAAQVVNFKLPTTPSGTVTLSKKALEKLPITELNDEQYSFWQWLTAGALLNTDIIKRTRNYWYKLDNADKPHIFNLKSNDHLKWLFFEKLGEEPLSQTDGGDNKVDEDFLDSMKDKYSWVQLLLDYKKLMKLKSTYIEGVLERHIDGVIYSSFLQFGPPSGRYASRDPNLQNLPRVKEDDSGLSELVLKYVNSIKKGFIAPKGYVICNADYSQLEPRAFAEACGDYLLQKVFHDDEDLYGSIACRVFSLDCGANEVKKKYPEYRQQAKIIALAVVYGAEAGRISQLMNIGYEEAQQIINDYLDSYPGLKGYMKNCNREACMTGVVKTKFGRVRHLPEAKRYYEQYGTRLIDRRWAKQNGLDEPRWKFKSMLNLAKNFKIQGVAAHVVNRSAIAINKEFKRHNIDGQIVAQVHDELTCIVPEKDAERAKEIVKRCMETTVTLSVPLKADPLIAKSWDAAK